MNLYIIPTNTCYWLACPIWDSDAYSEIYNIKNRWFDKPMAILVPDFEWLFENTPLTEEQLNFLSEYKRPFTILTDCQRISMLLEYSDDEMDYENKDQYKQIAFRVAHTDSQDEILEQEWPLFLTSANISGKPENYTMSDLKNTFWNKLNKDIEIIDEVDLDKNIAPSDIFSFIWDTLEINYLRKN